MKEKFLNAKRNNRDVVQPDIQELAVSNAYIQPNAGELPGNTEIPGGVTPFRNLNGAKTGGFTDPAEQLSELEANPQRDIDSMSDEDFADYINSAQEGRLSEVQAENADLSKNGQNDGNMTPKTGSIGQADAKIPANSSDPGIAAPAEKAKPFRTFATQGDYQAEIDRIIGDRLRKNREGMEQLDGLKQLALSFYGTNDSDFALSKLTDELKNHAARRKGMSVDDYNAHTRDRIDAEKYRALERRRMQKEQISRDLRMRWMRESEDLKTIVPDFDFAKAMGNRTFHDYITRGMSVGAAYVASTRNDPGLQTPAPKRRSIPQNGNMNRNGIGKVEMNVAGMSDAEFQKYINRIKN